MKKILNRVKMMLSGICLVDGFLILFMLILLTQSAHNLLANETSNNKSSIDIMVRTSEAAIFGYFLSSNFAKKYTADLKNSPDVLTITSSNADTATSAKNQIGFASADNTTDNTEKGIIEIQAQNGGCNKLQVIVVSCIGIASLLILLLLRNCFEMTAETEGTVSQLRDFISASVGFLVGCGKTKV